VTSLRVFFRGGVTSYRALFGWLTPWVAIPMFVVAPLFQLLFFAYLGRTTGVANDRFFVIGNALLAAALPGLLGMGGSISGERATKTLGMLLVSPASRVALFLGRALPAILNGFVVSAFCLACGALILDVHVGSVARLALIILVCAFSCAALGLCVGALSLRMRSVVPLGWIFVPILLLVSGANVPVARLPDWLQTLGGGLPMRHGIAAARAENISRELGLELTIAVVYAAAGLLLLRFFEYESRRTASLETM
jgi:ABC-2 type transport system permease protein